MTGRAAVASDEQRLDAIFARAGTLQYDPELLSDFAKYLCILVSGYLEKSLAELVLEHSRQVGAPSLQRFVESKTKRFANANAERIAQLLGSFDPGWKSSIESFLVDEYKAAVDSVVGLRNNIAHGVSVGVTYASMLEYYKRIKAVVEEVAKLCV
jgi:HEPN superfamily RiboL-PSP-like protein